MTNKPSPGPTFVIGIWRSGTSLLYTLLNQHPEIALMYEGDLLLLSPLFSGKSSKRDWQTRWEFWNSALSRHDIAASNISVDMPDLPTAATAVWKEYAGDASVFGEKSPDYFDSLQKVAREFPGAQFIIIWRDPAAICRSIIRASRGATFFAKPGIEHRAVIGTHKLKQECDALLRQGIRVHQIHYEEMVRDSIQVMTGICDFLGIPFDSKMCSLQGSDRSAIYEGSHHEFVKAETIVSSTERAEVLPAKLKRKIDRYVSYWKKRYNGDWPRYPETAAVSDYPGAVERFLDDARYRGLRILDGFTAFVYCYVPLSWLNSYRSFKNRRHQKAHAELAQARPAKTPAKAEALRRVEISELK
jgi:hypothetical protein